MRFYEITEARRNAKHPSQPTRSVVETFLKYKDRPDVFIQFTDLPKIGMNPMTNYNTPAGIYCYPVSEFAKKIKPEMTYTQFVDVFPFASTRPFLFFIRATKPITFIQDYTEDDLNRDRQKFMQITGQDEAKTEYHERQSRYKSPFGRLWGIMFSYIGKMEKSTIRWNSLLRKMGFHSIVDYGDGIIHLNEPTQAFFLSSSDYEVVEMLKVSKADESSLFHSKMKTVSEYGKKKIKQIRKLMQDPDKHDAARRQIGYSDIEIQLALLPDIIKVTRNTKDFELIANLHTVVIGNLPRDFIDFMAKHYSDMDNYSQSRIFKFVPIDIQVQLLLNGVIDFGHSFFYIDPPQLKLLQSPIRDKFFDVLIDYVGKIAAIGKVDYRFVDFVINLRTYFPPELADLKFKKYWQDLVYKYMYIINTVPDEVIIAIFNNTLIRDDHILEKIFNALDHNLKVQVFQHQLEFMVGSYDFHDPLSFTFMLPWSNLGNAFEECIGIFEDTIYGLVDIGQLNSTKPFDKALDFVRETYGKT